MSNKNADDTIIDNYLGQTVKNTQGNPRTDNSIKLIFRDKQVLAHLIRDISPEFKDVPYEELAAKYIETEPSIPIPSYKETINEGTENISAGEARINYDVRFKVNLPQQTGKQYCIHFDVEGQGKLRPGYDIRKRMMYYLGRMLSEQIPSLSKSENYNLLQPVTGIWIFYGPDVPVNAKGSIQVMELRNIKEFCFGTELFDETEFNFERLIMITVPDSKTGNHTLDVLQYLLSLNMDKDARVSGLEELGLVVNDVLKEEVGNMMGLIEAMVEAKAEAMVETMAESIAQKRYEEKLARDHAEKEQWKAKMAKLTVCLEETNRLHELAKAVQDDARADELFKEFNIN